MPETKVETKQKWTVSQLARELGVTVSRVNHAVLKLRLDPADWAGGYLRLFDQAAMEALRDEFARRQMESQL